MLNVKFIVSTVIPSFHSAIPLYAVAFLNSVSLSKSNGGCIKIAATILISIATLGRNAPA